MAISTALQMEYRAIEPLGKFTHEFRGHIQTTGDATGGNTTHQHYLQLTSEPTPLRGWFIINMLDCYTGDWGADAVLRISVYTGVLVRGVWFQFKRYALLPRVFALLSCSINDYTNISPLFNRPFPLPENRNAYMRVDFDIVGNVNTIIADSRVHGFLIAK